MNKHLKLQESLKANEIDAMLVSNFSNIFYYSKFKGTNATLLIFEEHRYLITDFRYEQQAKQLDTGYEVLCTTDEETLVDVINKLKKKHKFSSLGLEGDTITRNEWLQFEKTLTARLIDLNIDGVRAVKSADEVVLIKEAIHIAEKAFEDTMDYLKPGMSELEVCRYLENKMLDYGAEEPSFNTIVASGYRGALPHGVASDKIIEEHELITFDFGCKYKGYCSDITRTVALGTVDQQLIDIYNTVLEANLLGIETVRANMSGQEVDKVVRDFIDAQGYKGMFGHGLGHSFGVDIHEDPRLRSDVDHKLEVGNIVTIEPGIYVPGVGGVRIEDDILLTENGIEILTTLSKDLRIL